MDELLEEKSVGANEDKTFDQIFEKLDGSKNHNSDPELI